jgi:hypothetical protein
MPDPKYFEERFTSVPTNQPELPFFHTCDAFYLQGILESRKLMPTECEVFDKEKLLYLFYGKPAYKSSKSDSSKLLSWMPVCFILAHGSIKTVKRICAFDSGGFKEYSDCMHRGMTIQDFLMTPNLDSIQKTVDYFYESNKSYFSCSPKTQLDYDRLQFQVESYHTLISDGTGHRRDDRKASIEIQLDYDFELNKDSVLAVILPEHLAASPLVENIIKGEWGAEMITFENYGVASSNYYVHLIEKTKDFYLKHKLLHG